MRGQVFRTFLLQLEGGRERDTDASLLEEGGAGLDTQLLSQTDQIYLALFRGPQRHDY